MPAIDIPDPLPPAITPPRTVIEFLIDQDLDEYGDACLSPAPATGSCTDLDPSRSAAWTGRNSTPTGRHRLPPSPRKVPQ